MHIAVIGASALILFLIMGGLFMTAVVLEQRQRRRNTAAAAPGPAVPESAPVPRPKPKVMSAAPGR